MEIIHHIVKDSKFIYVSFYRLINEMHFAQSSKRLDDLFVHENTIGVWKIKLKSNGE